MDTFVKTAGLTLLTLSPQYSNNFAYSDPESVFGLSGYNSHINSGFLP
jgi:hypothetical protein